MRQIRVNDFVRLNQDIPEHRLQHGDVGVIRSESLFPAHTFEVEFHQAGRDHPTNIILFAPQLLLEEQSLFNDDYLGPDNKTRQQKLIPCPTSQIKLIG